MTKSISEIEEALTEHDAQWATLHLWAGRIVSRFDARKKQVILYKLGAKDNVLFKRPYKNNKCQYLKTWRCSIHGKIANWAYLHAEHKTVFELFDE